MKSKLTLRNEKARPFRNLKVYTYKPYQIEKGAIKMIRNKESGFTLLEVIIVIIIIGVLASLALPRFFSTVEYSRGTEAMNALATVRQSVERCYMMKSSYAACNVFGTLDVEDPATVPNAHFTYGIVSAAQAYTVTASRNTIDGGGAGLIRLTFNGTTITRVGTTPFGAIQ